MATTLLDWRNKLKEWAKEYRHLNKPPSGDVMYRAMELIRQPKPEELETFSYVDHIAGVALKKLQHDKPAAVDFWYRRAPRQQGTGPRERGIFDQVFDNSYSLPGSRYIGSLSHKVLGIVFKELEGPNSIVYIYNAPIMPASPVPVLPTPPPTPAKQAATPSSTDAAALAAAAAAVTAASSSSTPVRVKAPKGTPPDLDEEEEYGPPEPKEAVEKHHGPRLRVYELRELAVYILDNPAMFPKLSRINFVQGQIPLKEEGMFYYVEPAGTDWKRKRPRSVFDKYKIGFKDEYVGHCYTSDEHFPGLKFVLVRKNASSLSSSLVAAALIVKGDIEKCNELLNTPQSQPPPPPTNVSDAPSVAVVVPPIPPPDSSSSDM